MSVKGAVSGTGSNRLSPAAAGPLVSASIALASVVALDAALEPTVRGQLEDGRIDAESVHVLACVLSNAANIGLSGLGHGGSGIFAVLGVGQLPRRMSCSQV